MAQLQQNPPSSSQEMYLFNTNLTKTTGLDLSWYLDTGATHHMTFDKLYLAQYKELTTPLDVHLGDNNIRQAQGYSALTFSLPNNNHLHIHKVYFVPGLTKNLLLVSQATECGYTLTFKGNSYLFESQQADGTSHTIPYFKTQNLYPIPITPIKISNASHQIHNTGIQNTLKWHLRLGHPHLQALHTIRTHNLAGGIIGPFTHLTFCEGKMISNPYPRSTQYATNPLQLIHTDLCGPMLTPSLTGALYFLTFIDDYTHYTVITFLKQKSDALSHFLVYKNLVENQLNKKMKILRSDNGGEFNSKEFNNIPQSQGILHQTTIPNHPPQNGKTEK